MFTLGPDTKTVTLPDVIVNVDRAQHVVIERIEGGKTIDFGIFGEVADAVNAWLDLEDPDALAAPMNAYLLTYVTK